MNKWVLLVSTCAVLLGFAQEMAQATCESGEESLLLQTMSSSKDPHASCLKDINMTQTAWKELILAISESYPAGDYVKIAKDGIDKLYGYDIGTVMFKPTKAAVDQFRPTSIGALSYFVGYELSVRLATQRMAVLPSTTARAGKRLWLKTMTSVAWVILPLPKGTTSSPMLKLIMWQG